LNKYPNNIHSGRGRGRGVVVFLKENYEASLRLYFHATVEI
jgi:hypothetical protein